MSVDDTTQPEFYSPWPLLGKKFSKQLGEIRIDTEALHPLSRAAGFDDGTKLRNSALQAWEGGELDFHNKWRSYWDKTNTEVKFQMNKGTVECPVWDTFLTADFESGLVTIGTGGLKVDSGFYGNVLTALEEVAQVGRFQIDPSPFYNVTKLFVESNDFYFTADKDGHPILHASDSLRSGGGGGLSNVTITTTDLDGSLTPSSYATDKLTFDREDFYLSPDSADKPVVSLATRGTTVKQSNDLAVFGEIETLTFNRDDGFYVTQGSDSKESIINVTGASGAAGAKGDTGDTGAAGAAGAAGADGADGTGIGTQVQSFTSAVEWQFAHNLGKQPVLWSAFDDGLDAIIPDKVDVSDPNTAYFYFLNATAGTAILASGEAQAFYLTAKHSDDSAVFPDLQVISFNVDDFYLHGSQDPLNTDTVGVNLRSRRITVRQTDFAASFGDVDVVSFHTDGFYVTQNDGEREAIVNLQFDKPKLTEEESKAINIENPGASEDLSIFHASNGEVLTSMVAVLTGTTPSITWTIRTDSNRDATGTEVVTGGTATTSETTGDVVTSFSTDGVLAGHVWLETTAQSGVSTLSVTLKYTKPV